ncbi:hypothetical protein GPECTOR_8g134 [Gonium pectorale]|uniref:MIF4G-like type 2 domain-containing protein n=1 Tax=Gonium pectorale TaxID=33097 RepID=A0A150GSQ0_GONPE|nr:hypothetical protein GPECTOR_8g134 [Gonium pectorale]|eukprot:KXZ52742.1 hypothetical protein GPECTOR_8g134 [Gonium pectorale]
MGDRQYQQHNRGHRGGHGGGGHDGQHGGGGYRGGRGGGRGGGWQGGEGRGGGGRGGYGRGPGGPQHGGRGGGDAGGGGGGGFQRSYIGGGSGPGAGGKRGRDEGPEAGPPKLSPQHLLVAKLLGVCDRNTGSGRDQWSDERFFDDLLKSCRRDLEHGGDNVAGLLVEAAVEVSFKTQHYALVLGILNTERPDFSRRVVASVIADLNDCLAAPATAPRLYRAKQLLRFLAALHPVNVVPADWLAAALTGLVTAAAGGMAAAANTYGSDGGEDDEMGGGGGSGGRAAVQPWADFLVGIALLALPWCGRDLAAAEGGGGGAGGEGGERPSLAGLLAAVEAYVGSRPVAEDEALRPMAGARNDEDLAARSDSGGASFLGSLWSAVAECRDNAWEVQVLPGPHGPYLEKLAGAAPLEGLPQLEVPPWPPGLEPSLSAAVAAARVRALYPPRGGIRLLAREYLEGELPGVERLLVEEYVLDTLCALSSDSHLTHAQAAAVAAAQQQQQQQQQQQGQRRGGGPGGRRGGGGDADPDLLADDQAGGAGAMQIDGGAAAAAAGGGGGGDGEGEEREPAAAAWAGDPVAEAAAALVVYCRQEGSSVAAAAKARQLRPEQTSALWSSKVTDWLHAHGRQLAEEQGPLAAPKVLATLLLALGVKSPSHLHVAVERYAEALRAALAEADAEAAAQGALPAGSWEGAAAALGASPGQVAMIEVVRHYHAREPQRLLLVTDRLLALHVLDGPSLVAALFADGAPPPPPGAGGRRRRRGGATGEGEEPDAEAAGEGDDDEEIGGEEGGRRVCALSCFDDPVLCGGLWEVLLHGVDRLVRMPEELPSELADWDKKLAQLQAIHTGLVQSVAAGAPGLAQRERDVAAQVEQAGRCLEVVRGRLERSSATAQDALLLMYLGFIRLLNRAAADAHAAMDDAAAGAAEATSSLLAAWLHACLRRYGQDSAALLGSGRLREEAAAHEAALGGPPPAAFQEAVRLQLGISM